MNAAIFALTLGAVAQLHAVTPQPDLLSLVVQEARKEIGDGGSVVIEGKSYASMLRYDPARLYVDLASFTTRNALRYTGGMGAAALQAQVGVDFTAATETDAVEANRSVRGNGLFISLDAVVPGEDDVITVHVTMLNNYARVDGGVRVCERTLIIRLQTNEVDPWTVLDTRRGRMC